MQMWVYPGYYVTVPSGFAYGVTFGEVRVERAPASCASTEQQIVTVDVRVIGFATPAAGAAPQWRVLTTKSNSVRLDPGYSAVVHAQDIYPTVAVSNLHVDLDIQWWTATGKYLGRAWVSYNASADYHCLSGARCSIAIDPTYGAYIKQ
jgi:hypothetical protein